MKRIACVALLCSFATLGLGADLKVTMLKDSDPPDQAQPAGSSATLPADSDSVTIYVHGAAQRVEFFGPIPWIQRSHMLITLAGVPQRRPHIAVITHCDTGQVDELYLDTHTYIEFKAPKYLVEKDFLKLAEKARTELEKHTTTTTTDTGESKDFFGHRAHHKVTTLMQKTAGNRISSSVLHGKTVTTEVTYYRDIQYHETIDGWYIDLPQPGCAPEYLRQGLAVRQRSWMTAVLALSNPVIRWPVVMFGRHGTTTNSDHGRAFGRILQCQVPSIPAFRSGCVRSRWMTTQKGPQPALSALISFTPAFFPQDWPFLRRPAAR
jgi:hypothetical protein